ncbi:hypothetical protein CGG78_23975, partial [Vibrio parahaemolyticus]|uniref:hypothetical protein n=1 Tax=Vibrio parahaemolyticus TaxID=670 RepID=UPI0011214670
QPANLIVAEPVRLIVAQYNAMRDMLNLPPSMQVKAKVLLESVELRKSNFERNKTDQKSENDTFER